MQQQQSIIPNILFSPPRDQQAVDIIPLESVQQRHGHGQLNHHPEAPHRVEFYMLIQITQGYGEHFIDFRRYPFQANSLIFINKRQIHAFDFSQNPQGKIILFTDEFIHQLQTNIRIPSFSPFYLSDHWCPVFNSKPHLQWQCAALITAAEKELTHSHGEDMIVMLLFSALLMMIMREQKPLEDQCGSPLEQKQLLQFQQFGQLLEQHFTQTRDADDYASRLNITYKTLNQVCKQVSQKTAKQVIDHYIILEAKRRLALGIQSVQQLADELGFDETSNFVKYFKRHAQVTPAQFRKVLQG